MAEWTHLQLGCSTLPLWWSPRARAPVSGYALEGHVADAGVRWRVSWDVADAGYGCALTMRPHWYMPWLRLLLLTLDTHGMVWRSPVPSIRQGSPYAGYGHAALPQTPLWGRQTGYLLVEVHYVGHQLGLARGLLWAHPDQNWPRDTNSDVLVRPIPLLIQGQNGYTTHIVLVPIRT